MGGGYGGGMGGYRGMPSDVHPGGRPDATPSMRPGERSIGQPPGDRTVGSERASSGPRAPGELLQQNSRLAERLRTMLPAGTDVRTAAEGFRNLGEFVAAVHVSHNLGIPFADVKARMMTGDSLGDAIRALRPEADAQVEARRARSQADSDLGNS